MKCLDSAAYSSYIVHHTCTRNFQTVAQDNMRLACANAVLAVHFNYCVHVLYAKQVNCVNIEPEILHVNWSSSWKV